MANRPLLIRVSAIRHRQRVTRKANRRVLTTKILDSRARRPRVPLHKARVHKLRPLPVTLQPQSHCLLAPGSRFG